MNNDMQIKELQQIRDDFYGIIDNDANLSPEMRKKLLKGIVGNFFDYIEEKVID